MAKSRTKVTGQAVTDARTTAARKTPRTPVQVPNDWLAVVGRLATHHEKPRLWVLLKLIDKEARALGLTELPPLPWAREADQDE